MGNPLSFEWRAILTVLCADLLYSLVSGRMFLYATGQYRANNLLVLLSIFIRLVLFAWINLTKNQKKKIIDARDNHTASTVPYTKTRALINSFQLLFVAIIGFAVTDSLLYVYLWKGHIIPFRYLLGVQFPLALAFSIFTLLSIKGEDIGARALYFSFVLFAPYIVISIIDYRAPTNRRSFLLRALNPLLLLLTDHFGESFETSMAFFGATLVPPIVCFITLALSLPRRSRPHPIESGITLSTDHLNFTPQLASAPPLSITNASNASPTLDNQLSIPLLQEDVQQTTSPLLFKGQAEALPLNIRRHPGCYSTVFSEERQSALLPFIVHSPLLPSSPFPTLILEKCKFNYIAFTDTLSEEAYKQAFSRLSEPFLFVKSVSNTYNSSPKIFFVHQKDYRGWEVRKEKLSAVFPTLNTIPNVPQEWKPLKEETIQDTLYHTLDAIAFWHTANICPRESIIFLDFDLREFALSKSRHRHVMRRVVKEKGLMILSPYSVTSAFRDTRGTINIVSAASLPVCIDAEDALSLFLPKPVKLSGKPVPSHLRTPQSSSRDSYYAITVTMARRGHMFEARDVKGRVDFLSFLRSNFNAIIVKDIDPTVVFLIHASLLPSLWEFLLSPEYNKLFAILESKEITEGDQIIASLVKRVCDLPPWLCGKHKVTDGKVEFLANIKSALSSSAPSNTASKDLLNSTSRLGQETSIVPSSDFFAERIKSYLVELLYLIPLGPFFAIGFRAGATLCFNYFYILFHILVHYAEINISYFIWKRAEKQKGSAIYKTSAVTALFFCLVSLATLEEFSDAVYDIIFSTLVAPLSIVLLSTFIDFQRKSDVICFPFLAIGLNTGTMYFTYGVWKHVLMAYTGLLLVLVCIATYMAHNNGRRNSVALTRTGSGELEAGINGNYIRDTIEIIEIFRHNNLVCQLDIKNYPCFVVLVPEGKANMLVSVYSSTGLEYREPFDENKLKQRHGDKTVAEYLFTSPATSSLIAKLCDVFSLSHLFSVPIYNLSQAHWRRIVYLHHLVHSTELSLLPFNDADSEYCEFLYLLAQLLQPHPIGLYGLKEHPNPNMGATNRPYIMISSNGQEIGVPTVRMTAGGYYFNRKDEIHAEVLVTAPSCKEPSHHLSFLNFPWNDEGIYRLLLFTSPDEFYYSPVKGEVFIRLVFRHYQKKLKWCNKIYRDKYRGFVNQLSFPIISFVDIEKESRKNRNDRFNKLRGYKYVGYTPLQWIQKIQAYLEGFKKKGRAKESAMEIFNATHYLQLSKDEFLEYEDIATLFLLLGEYDLHAKYHQKRTLEGLRAWLEKHRNTYKGVVSQNDNEWYENIKENLKSKNPTFSSKNAAEDIRDLRVAYTNVGGLYYWQIVEMYYIYLRLNEYYEEANVIIQHYPISDNTTAMAEKGYERFSVTVRFLSNASYSFLRAAVGTFFGAHGARVEYLGIINVAVDASSS